MTPLEATLAYARENYGYNRHSDDQREKLKYVLSRQGPERWRAAANFYLYLNPVSMHIDPETGVLVKTEDARMQNRNIIAAVKEIRQELELTGNKFGTSDDVNIGRLYRLSMPAAMLRFIEMIDPDVLSGNTHERKASIHALMRTFPEYCVSPVI